MAKSIKFKNNVYLDTSSIWIKRENTTLNNIAYNTDFIIISGKRKNEHNNKVYTAKLGNGNPELGFGTTEYLSSVALELVDDNNNGQVVGRLDVCSNGGIYNFKTGNKIMEETYELINPSDFFTSTNFNIESAYIYKIGNMINIQRLVFNNVPKKNTAQSVGVIKNKYRAKLSHTMRVPYSTGGYTIDGIAFFNNSGTLEVENTITNTGAVGNVYIFNVTYLMKEK